MTPQDYRNEVLGQRFDIDGYYGAQCWDGYAHYMQNLGYGYAHCTSSGYVRDVWNNRTSNGMHDSCEVVTIMQQGDVAVFGVTAETPYSHIAIFMRDNGNGTGVFLGQNQGGTNGAYNEVTFSYSGILGAFRPKCFLDLFKKEEYVPETGSVLNEIPSDFRYESETFKCEVDAINIRRAPSTSGEDTGLDYVSGQTVNYDGYVNREGYIWISWISASEGTRRWMAVRETATNKAYGSFY